MGSEETPKKGWTTVVFSSVQCNACAMWSLIANRVKKPVVAFCSEKRWDWLREVSLPCDFSFHRALFRRIECEGHRPDIMLIAKRFDVRKVLWATLAFQKALKSKYSLYYFRWFNSLSCCKTCPCLKANLWVHCARPKWFSVRCGVDLF